MNDKINSTLEAADIALKELLAEESKISQYAIEKRAGLSNGALNYNHPSYIDFKSKIMRFKDYEKQPSTVDKKIKEKMKNEMKLKDKYRNNYNDIRKRNRILEAENKELLYQLFQTQLYIKHLEEQGLTDSSVLNFTLNRWDKL